MNNFLFFVSKLYEISVDGKVNLVFDQVPEVYNQNHHHDWFCGKATVNGKTFEFCYKEDESINLFTDERTKLISLDFYVGKEKVDKYKLYNWLQSKPY